MSIQLTVPPAIRPFRAFAEPELPDGYWAVHAAVLGDASGGLMSINVRFSTGTEPNPSSLWNLEQLMLRHTAVTALNCRIDYGNMDVQPNNGSTGALNKVYQLFLIDMGAVDTGAAGSLLSNQLPLFLGAARKEVNSDLAFDVNNVNAASFVVMAQGYFWGPGAINAPGGPQRPARGLFGG